MPLTYNLPSEYPILKDEFNKMPGALWIAKPVARSQGKGIFIFDKLAQIADWKSDSRYKPDNANVAPADPQVEQYVVQRYIDSPLLLGGKKFDLRIYVLVMSYNPLTVYLYREGFARFTCNRYTLEDIENQCTPCSPDIHLTNIAIVKTSDDYGDGDYAKWMLRSLKLYMASKYGEEPVAKCFAGIQSLIVNIYKSVQKTIINSKNSFELYGLDIIIDSNLKPWLLEVNACPSFTASTKEDEDLKVNLLDDCFTIVDMEKM